MVCIKLYKINYNKFFSHINFFLEIGNSKKKFGTIVGISNWNEWKWPIEGDEAGYILAHALPHTGSWHRFSPEKIAKLVKTPIEKPQPIATNHTNQNKPWTVPIPRVSGALAMILLFIRYILFILESNLLDKENFPQH
jgi:hypothetical protein